MFRKDFISDRTNYCNLSSMSHLWLSSLCNNICCKRDNYYALKTTNSKLAINVGCEGRFSYVNRSSLQQMFANPIQHGGGEQAVWKYVKTKGLPLAPPSVELTAFENSGCRDSKGLFWVMGARLETIQVCLEKKGFRIVFI